MQVFQELSKIQEKGQGCLYPGQRSPHVPTSVTLLELSEVEQRRYIASNKQEVTGSSKYCAKNGAMLYCLL